MSFLRGCYYFLLANFYGKPYVASTAESDPAVPIKTSNYVEDKYYSRNSVAEVYKQIVTDLLDAEKFLKDVPKKSMWRAGYKCREIDVKPGVFVYVFV